MSAGGTCGVADIIHCKMAWTPQNQPGPNGYPSANGGAAPVPDRMPASPLQPAPANPNAPMPNPNAMSVQPAQQGERYMPNEMYSSPGAANMNQAPAPQFSAPQYQQAQVPAVAQAAPQPGIPGMPSAKIEDDNATADDARWINRTKHVIAQTHGDPYRQVQLLQQLRVVYLKERYGRAVQAKDN